MKATSNATPRTVEDLVRSIWYKRLRTLVSNFRLSEPIEDTLGDIVLELIEKDYLARWTPEAGSYSNWLYTFAGNICKKKYNRSHTRGGFAIENAASLSYTTSENEEFGQGVVFEEYLPTDIVLSICAEESADYNILVEQIEKMLEKFPAHSQNVYEGVIYSRDMKTTFRLIREEYQPKEIAEFFGTSVEFVYTLIRRIRPLVKPVLAL